MEEVNGMFKFTFENPSEVVPIINSWLSLNSFELKSDKNGSFFQSGSSFTYVKYMEYYVGEKSILLNPYIGSRKKPLQLDEKFWGSAYKQAYRDELQGLFAQLDQLSVQQNTISQFNSTYNMSQNGYGQNGGYANLNGNPYNTGNVGYVSGYSEIVDNMKKDHDSRTEHEVVIAFVISIVGMFLPLFGFYFGIIICIYTYICAVKGINTSKRGFAIATLAFSTLDIIILILAVLNNIGIL